MNQYFQLILRAVVCSLALVLTACGSVSVTDYADNRPLMLPSEFFNGHLIAHGVVKNRSGKVIRSFSADITASWKEGIGTLEEEFLFNDGEKQRRVWTLKPDGAGGYIGTAGDVVGEATMAFAGNSLFLTYVLRVPYGDNKIDVSVDDRMYLINEATLLNESVLTKWGFKVGSLMLVIEKQH